MVDRPPVKYLEAFILEVSNKKLDLWGDFLYTFTL